MNKNSSKRMIGAIVLVLVAALVLAWLLKDKNQRNPEKIETATNQDSSNSTKPILNFKDKDTNSNAPMDTSATTTPTILAEEKKDTATPTDKTAKAAEEKTLAEKAKETLKEAVTFEVRPENVRPKIIPSEETQAKKEIETTKKIEEAKKAEETKKAAAKDQPRLVNEERARESRATREERSNSRSTNTSQSNVTTSNNSTSDEKQYVIQLMATINKMSARDLKNALAKDGYTVFIEKYNQFYRVRIGTYTTKNKAAKTQSILKKRYTQNDYVQNSTIMFK